MSTPSPEPQPDAQPESQGQAAPPSFGDLSAFQWLEQTRVSHRQTTQHHLESIWQCGAADDLLDYLQNSLANLLPGCVDVDATIANLDRFIAASRSPMGLLSLFERDPSALPALICIFEASQTLANRLISDPESFDLMRASDGQPSQRKFLVDELVAELETVDSLPRAAAAIRKFNSREMVRIAYGEFVREMSPVQVGAQLADVADAILEAALRFVMRRLDASIGAPILPDGQHVQISLIGLGNLGGKEMVYGGPLEVLFLYDRIEQRNESHQKYVTDLVGEVLALVTSQDQAALGPVIDDSFRPLGEDVLIGSSDVIAGCLESDGRTWQRIRLTKARVVAGDKKLGQSFLKRLQPWVYRHFLSRQDFRDIRSLRRKLQRRFDSTQNGVDDVSTAPGGRQDIELMMQFLQLLHGGDSQSVRVVNTSEAISQLEREGCLTHQEATLLGKGYARLCRLQHQMSVMFGRYSSCLPSDDAMRRRLAWHLGVRTSGEAGAIDEAAGSQLGDLERFHVQLSETLSINRKMLNHLMVEAPQGDEDDEQDDFAMETELVLDPSPDPELVTQTLLRHGFENSLRAMDHIRSLATESVRFLSRRRCHHFLAAIAPDLLAEIAKTPDPDRTLRTLAAVADSIGGKSSLWELLGANHATMQLVVRLCAATPYLSDILTQMPGMIDELIDSLVMDRLPSAERLDAQSIDLCRRAVDLDVVLHGFKNSAHLMIGVRDILGKDSIEATHQSLSDTAEACVRRIAEYEQELLAQRFGDPVGNDGQPAELIAMALGKFGGREPNYHSDLDVVFVYSDDGETQRRVGGPRKTVSNAQFFNQLTQAIVTRVNHSSEYGRLFELDGRLRPSGEEGVLAVSSDQFHDRFRRGLAPAWQRLSLCKARVISGSRHVRRKAASTLVETLQLTQWHEAMLNDVRELRMRMQQTAGEDNLKRGAGGTVDIEFIAQMLTLQNIHAKPEVLTVGTIATLEKLADLGYLDAKDAADLVSGYRTLRRIEANLRLMNTPARHELPDDDSMLRDLAFLMDEPAADRILMRVQDTRRRNRELFDKYFQS